MTFSRLFAPLALAPLVGLVLLAAPVAAQAQAYPTKPIRYLIPFPAGGATDILGRAVAAKLTEQLGQQVVVENRPGAGGNLGTEIVAKTSAPDGYTILMGSVANTIAETLYPKLNFDFRKDLLPVALVARLPNVMVVTPSVPARTAQEFVAWAKARPGQVNFASSGNGTSIHLSGEMFKSMTGIEMTHVPYRGSALALTDLLAGQVQVMFDNLPPSLPHVKSGGLRALAVTSDQRSPALPDVPTVAESGIAGFEATSWFGILAPAGTPDAIVDRLNSEVNIALKTPDVASRLAEMAFIPAGGSRQDFGRFIATEIEKWGKVVKASGAKVD